MRPTARPSFRPAALATAAALACALLAAAPADAQQWALGARYGSAEPSGAAYEAVYDETLSLPGVQVEVRWPTWYLRLAGERGEADGELIAIAPDGTVFGTGIASQLSLDVVHLTAGWRRAPSPWGFHAGGGATQVSGDEETFFFSESVSGTGFHVVAGVDLALAQHWEVGAEAMWWQVSDLFDGGAGLALDDPDLEAVEVAAFVNFTF